MHESTFPTFHLNDGNGIPSIGIGCWMGYVGSGADSTVADMVLNALNVGYRHIDTAFNYGNEVAVGTAIQESGISRQDIYVTTKLAGEYHASVMEGLQKSLDNLGMDYVDLFLMHWPQALTENGEALKPDEHPTFVDTWKEMEKLLPTGKVKSIGVSNFSIKNLETLLEETSVVPAVNQVELHPLLPQHSLLSFCTHHGIRLTAYSPLGKYKSMLVEHPVVVGIMADRSSKGEGGGEVTAAQVILGWCVGKGVVAVPKCRDVERMRENLTFVHLTASEMHALDKIHEGKGMHRSVCGFHTTVGGEGGCFGWTYEELGWDMREGGIAL